MSGKIVIIGGGISGLTAAWWLHKMGADVTVLEKDQTVGGTIRSVRESGWLVETGPNSALETTPLFNEMFEGLGITSERLYADDRSNKRYILRDGRLHPLPMSAGSFLSSSLWTLAGKLRLLKEPFIGRSEKDETIAEFVERRLGKEFLDYAINPFVAGVYAGNPEQLSVRAAFPKLYALEQKYGGLVKGMVKGRRERKQRSEKAKDRAKMFSFKNGMATFPQTIAEALGDKIIPGCDVESLEQGDQYKVIYSKSGSQLESSADVVICAAPSFVTSRIVHSLSASLSSSLDKIVYPPVTEVFLGFRDDQINRPLDGFGFLVPAVEKRKILGTLWSSSLFPHRAPEGHVALTTFVGGSRQPELSGLQDDEIVRMVTEELGSIMGVAGVPVFSKIIRWQKAIPQYNLGHDVIVKEIEKCEVENPGLFFCSNFRGGIAVGDCVMSGKKTADRIVEYLASKATVDMRAAV